MPRKCCVPGCRGNYDVSEKISVFKFPTDPHAKNTWMKKIPRADFQPTSQSVVCAKHFSEQFIVRVNSATRPDGSVLTVERTRPKLTDDAYPTIFPNCPSYLSDEPAPKRRKPEDRRVEAEQRDEATFYDWLEADKIPSFTDFSDKLQHHVPDKWIHRLHNTTTSEVALSSGCQYWSFYNIAEFSKPILSCVVRVFSDMHVEIFTDKENEGALARVPNNSLKWLFSGQASPPVLTTWSQFDSVMSHFSSTDSAKDKKQSIEVLISALQELYSEDNTDEKEIKDEEERESSQNYKPLFLVEQLKLLLSPVKRYTSETVLWAFQVYASTPTSYALLRNTVLTLPHPSYLKRLAASFNMETGLKAATLHEEYLRKKCETLTEGEKNVILMMDEIYVSNQLSYKEGKLEGYAENAAHAMSEATTAQVFMVSSVLSKTKDVVAIVPVKNMTADVLHEMTVNVLSTLHKIGYTIICVISDNNRVNRNAFALMCGGKLQVCIPNPFRPYEKLFFLFDSVHLFKCIRNNWLNQKDVEKTFLVPSFLRMSGDLQKLTASFSHLRKLFTAEKVSVLKLAPALNQKSLFPTATEKQNVHLMLKVFDKRNVVALEHFEKMWHTDTKGTREFLDTVVKLWNILNVKHPSKHIRLRNEDCRPIASASDPSMQFLRQVIQWLQDWQQFKLRPREGCLSSETMSALTHTLTGLVEITSYLLEEKHLKYVLLGKFQSDSLEFRFSRYRQLSGCNYHVSVQQLLEGEKKLKLMSVLKVVSASNGTITLKDITIPLDEKRTELTASSDKEYTSFLETLHECDNMELTPEQMKALVFVSGYAVSKVLPHTDCDGCKTKLTFDKILQVEATEDCHTYLSALDRGGLTWPSDLAVDTVRQIFKIFQCVVGTKVCEQQFLSCVHHRKVLMNLAAKRLTATTGKCEQCGLAEEELLLKCCRPAINIFLNNYSRGFCDRPSTGSSKRKLKTLAN